MWDDTDVIIDLWAYFVLYMTLLNWKLPVPQAKADICMNIYTFPGGMRVIC